MTGRRYPLRPLLDLLGEASDTAAARRLRLSGASMAKYRRIGVSVDTAERLALRAKLHPFEVWPEFTDDRCAAETSVCPGCGGPFVRRYRTRQVYCSPRCRTRMTARKIRQDPAQRAKQAVYARRYRAETRETAKAYSRRYYRNNRERLLQAQRNRDQSKKNTTPASPITRAPQN